MIYWDVDGVCSVCRRPVTTKVEPYVARVIDRTDKAICCECDDTGWSNWKPNAIEEGKANAEARGARKTQRVKQLGRVSAVAYW
jgi:hypothetical protein